MTMPTRILILAGALALALPAGPVAASPDAADAQHAAYDALLQRHVHGLGVDYEAWVASDADHQALGDYVGGLAALDPAGWPRADRLAYWLNLYNAVTLRLILDNYPLQSIKDLGGFLKTSPWKRDLVAVAGRDLTLDQIEHDIIRPEFGDPRIHFALNCASVGCPPLQPHAYRAADLSAQLDHACRQTLDHERWVRVDDDAIAVTAIFDWYGDDFRQDGGSVRGFIDRYRDTPLPDRKITFMSYDWSLNRAR